MLLASALDSRTMLQRRLKSMLSNPTTGRRLSGRMAVLAAIAVALPFTATRAIHYVDVLAPSASNAAPAKMPVPVLPAPALAAVAQPAPVTPVAPAHLVNITDDKVTINGQTKKWSELTPAEKAEVRRSIAQAREEISRINQGEIQREVREAMNEARIDQEEVRRELAAARIEVDQAMREIDANAGEIRRAGQYPEQIKATVRASLKAVEAIDVQASTRQPLASVDPATINAALAAAEAGLEKAEAELECIEEANERDDD
jgi:hypothetical protein